ncbi:LOW QUALITY PROTEIN: mannosyl-oligosaccharidealpha-1,2-mannosidase-r el ated [Schistosoma mansoni]|uniref:mannosyl-oligosaccharidealpha-1,2-mannosidase-r el ated n=1 Tax=Schistosoma mansoni TaxID=6183 RepID=UPI00022C8292|nr:LOW QUALITY PROTEIN: mannosyl-oligosaccharidealpha-1,2-mannosidase-r el ated [Schistosoma mansoni]|eukprot:XP_018647200.1 LOW QUALITY PROTEIN: mannosyl-oligosaccharidealpha-1,2-mannosidase-r el ated [Schistosoma mansoni]
MFLHAYNNYKDNAFPADELMPLTCKGRYRWTGVNRGDIDDALGNFSLTMLDGLDSLFLIGELDEFEVAVKAVTRTVRFDSDVDVSVFETNIRVLGGLLGAHVAVMSIKQNNDSRMNWYKNELLEMAVDIGNRLLPAFDTPTGIPYPRINLRHGYSGLTKQEENTCTACAGTMILEFAALSRLTGNPIYEEKAAKAMAFLWKQRNRFSDLVGRVINVRNGDWIRQESGVGAGIDSYYEYLLKAYILLGEPVYLHRFQTHYEAVNRYVSGPQSAEFPFLFLDVHMHRPAQRARTFMDALLAFWPGIQVLTGDVKRAVVLHELLYLIHKRNKLLPEAFTPDFNVHWGQHLLRPELIESTYLLYRATEDPYYLKVGEQIVNDLEKYTRVPCGFAAIKDVRTMEHVDQFDSFVLAETFKYLYLLFAEPSDIPINVDDYIFTTEAHLLPLSLSRQRYSIQNVFHTGIPNVSSVFIKTSQYDVNSSILSQSSSTSNVESSFVRSISDHHGDRDLKIEKLLHNAAQLLMSNFNRSTILSDHFPFSSSDLAMPHSVSSCTESLCRCNPPSYGFIKFSACPAHFGLFPGEELIPGKGEQQQTEAGTKDSNAFENQAKQQQSSFSSSSSANPNERRWKPLVGPVRVVYPMDACQPIMQEAYAYPSVDLQWNQNSTESFNSSLLNSSGIMRQSKGSISGAIGIVRRGGCVFVEKAYHLVQAGAIGVIIVDNKPDTSSEIGPLFALSGDDDELNKKIHIPIVLLLSVERDQLLNLMRSHWNQTNQPLNVMLTKEYDVAGSPKEISIWRDLFVMTLKQIGINNDCYHLILAFIQITLHKLSPMDSFHYTNKTINVSIEYYHLVTNCFIQMVHLCNKSIKHNDYYYNDNNQPSKTVITLQLGFQLIPSSSPSTTSTMTETTTTHPHHHLSSMVSSNIINSSTVFNQTDNSLEKSSLYNDEL